MKVFVVCPITKYIGRSGERVLRADYRAFVEGLCEILEPWYEETFVALREEAWGEKVLPPAVCTARDFAELRSSDLVLAWPEDSCGCAIELGWASALGKPIIVMVDAAASTTPLLLGLHAVSGTGRVDEVRLAVGSFEQRLRCLAELLPPLLDAHAEAPAGLVNAQL